MSKVTVVIPVYNVEDYLGECLESVINQTLQDIEIVCINDASTDNSAVILNDYGLKDSRIHIYDNQINQGLSYTRNRGIELAVSDYIYFLDSDDAIELNMLEELYNKAEKEKLEIIYFDAGIIYMSEELKRANMGYKAVRNCSYPGIYRGADLFNQFIANDDFAVSMCRQFFRLDFVRENKLSFYYGMLHEDNLFSVRAILLARRTAYIPRKYFKRRFRENSIMTNQTTMKNVEGLFNNYYELLKFWEASELDSKTLKSLDIFLNLAFRRAKHYYGLVPYNKRSLPIFTDERYKWNMFYNSIICAEKGGVILNGISKEKVDIIAKADKVIIYGAGIVGRDVLNILDKHRIPVYSFAVTEMADNPKEVLRVPVRGISEFSKEGNDFLFIVAVTKVYEDEIVNYLRKQGFNNIVLINE